MKDVVIKILKIIPRQKGSNRTSPRDYQSSHKWFRWSQDYKAHSLTRAKHTGPVSHPCSIPSRHSVNMLVPWRHLVLVDQYSCHIWSHFTISSKKIDMITLTFKQSHAGKVLSTSPTLLAMLLMEDPSQCQHTTVQTHFAQTVVFFTYIMRVLEQPLKQELWQHYIGHTRLSDEIFQNRDTIDWNKHTIRQEPKHKAGIIRAKNGNDQTWTPVESDSFQVHLLCVPELCSPNFLGICANSKSDQNHV